LGCLLLDVSPPNAHFASAQDPAGASSSEAFSAMNAQALDVLGAGVDTAQVKSLKDPVSLEYRNAPLVDVLRSLADSARINLALSTQVASQKDLVTIRLSGITYEVALKTILDLYKLGAIVENGILRIDTQANLSKERQDKIISKIEIWQTEPTRTLIFQVNYGKAGDLSGILDKMMDVYKKGDPRFTVNFDARTNKVMVQGVSDALIRAKSLLEGLDKRKQQVLVEARIVEASSELSRTLSVTWGTRFGIDAQRGLSSGLVFPNSVVGNIGGAGSLGGNAPAPGQGASASQLGSMGFTLGSINGMVNIDGILRAYETESLANIIASPRIVVEDQETATIDERGSVKRNVLIGSESSSRDTTSRLALSVKPQITSDNMLELELEVQRLTPNNAPTDPVQGSTERTVKTKLMVENGDTAVIGGLYQTQKFKGQGRIPFLGRLPIIGFLFRTNDSMMARSELMVLITPRILPQSKRPSDSLSFDASSGGGLPNSLLGAPSVEAGAAIGNGVADPMANGSSGSNTFNAANTANAVNNANQSDAFNDTNANANTNTNGNGIGNGTNDTVPVPVPDNANPVGEIETFGNDAGPLDEEGGNGF
jgi:type IV pilus secretin PilQ/predicted competence protein